MDIVKVFLLGLVVILLSPLLVVLFCCGLVALAGTQLGSCLYEYFPNSAFLRRCRDFDVEHGMSM